MRGLARCHILDLFCRSDITRSLSPVLYQLLVKILTFNPSPILNFVRTPGYGTTGRPLFVTNKRPFGLGAGPRADSISSFSDLENYSSNS